MKIMMMNTASKNDWRFHLLTCYVNGKKIKMMLTAQRFQDPTLHHKHHHQHHLVLQYHILHLIPSFSFSISMTNKHYPFSLQNVRYLLFIIPNQFIPNSPAPTSNCLSLLITNTIFFRSFCLLSAMQEFISSQTKAIQTRLPPLLPAFPLNTTTFLSSFIISHHCCHHQPPSVSSIPSSPFTIATAISFCSFISSTLPPNPHHCHHHP